MGPPQSIRRLPGFVALGAHAVLHGRKKGESVQLDETYFNGQLTVLEAIGSSGLERRTRTIRDSLDVYEDMRVESDAITRETLREESRRFRETLQDLPEVVHLRDNFPGTCIVVPEWDRASGGVGYGPRVYFFRDGDAPDPEDIVRRNIDAVLAEDRERFERYQGHLHGYPGCCIDFFHTRAADSVPEQRSVAPFADRVDEEALANEPASVSVEDLFPGLLEDEGAYAFFAREFYPEPGCDTARGKGERIYDELAAAFPDRLVADYFRLNFGFSYLMADRVGGIGTPRPSPGALGREHLYSYLPLGGLLTASRYR